MIIQKDFLNRLKDFGINSYESKIWTAVLSRGISTAGELSDIANVPRSRCYDVLESLEKKGFVILKLGKPIKYIAVTPEDVLIRIKKRIKEEADKQSEFLDTIKSGEILKELNILYKQGTNLIDVNELTGSLKGRDNIYSRIENMLNKAEKNILISTTERGILRKYESLKVALEKANKRGVKIKIIAPATKNNKQILGQFSKFAGIRDGEGRGRFCIVDGKELVFMLMDDKVVHPSYDTGVWVNTPVFSGSLENMFNNLWKTLKPAK